MEPHEQQEMLAALEKGRSALLEVLSGVTEEAATRRPAPGRWSVLECVEHLVMAEDFLFSRLEASRFSEAPLAGAEREARIRARGLDRSRPMASPEVAQPKGRFPTLAEAVEHFLGSRQRTTEFVENCKEDLRSRMTDHPIAGPINCHETLLIMAVHPLRHAEQIREIRAALGPTPE